jgi:hypothetical protein
MRLAPAFGRQNDLDTEAVAFGVSFELSTIPVARAETLSNIGQTDAVPAPTRGFGIKIIFDGNEEILRASGVFRILIVLTVGLAAHIDLYVSTLGETRDSVSYGVFDERLQEQRGDGKPEGVWGHEFLDVQTRSETNFFNREKRTPGQAPPEEKCQFFAHSAAKKISQQDAHLARLDADRR